MTARPRILVILTENWTMADRGDLRALVQWGVAVEAAGLDGVMVSDHVVLGASADAAGRPANPREYALEHNQDPATPWPSPVVLLSAIAAATSRIRLVLGAVIAPLRHPLALAKDLATLDLLCEGRLVVQPTVGWHRDEYDALGVPFRRRGDLLDEHLAIWREVWTRTPASFEGRYYRFRDVYLEPKPHRPGGPTLWFGGSSVHDRLLRRLVRYGRGFNPLGQRSVDELARLDAAMAAAGRDPADLEMVGGIRATFTDSDHPADLTAALATVPEQIEQGFSTFCIKPSQFTDDPAAIRDFCQAVAEATQHLVVLPR